MGPLLPQTVSSPLLPQVATAVTTRTLLHGPAKCSCASGTSGGELSPSHRLNALARSTSLVAATAAMAAMGTAVAVMEMSEGTWPGECEGVRGGAGDVRAM